MTTSSLVLNPPTDEELTKFEKSLTWLDSYSLPGNEIPTIEEHLITITELGYRCIYEIRHLRKKHGE